MSAKVATTCTSCRKKRYLVPPVPKDYVCQRCRDATPAAKESKPAPAPPRSGDPFYRDDERKRAVNARARPAWLGRRRGWLK